MNHKIPSHLTAVGIYDYWPVNDISKQLEEGVQRLKNALFLYTFAIRNTWKLLLIILVHFLFYLYGPNSVPKPVWVEWGVARNRNISLGKVKLKQDPGSGKMSGGLHCIALHCNTAIQSYTVYCTALQCIAGLYSVPIPAMPWAIGGAWFRQ